MTKKAFYVCVQGTPTDPEDGEVPGINIVEIDLSSTPSESEIAGAALDEFHDNVAIAMLDDFEIDVLDANGKPYSQGEDYVERSMQHIASHEGMISDEDAPKAVADFMK